MCTRPRAVRFWICWFLLPDYQRSPVLCFGAAIPAPSPPAPNATHASPHPWLIVASTGNTCGQETQSATPCSPCRNTQCCNQRSFLKVGQAARYICGKGRDSGICHGQPRDWNTMVLNVLHKPSKGTTQHTSVLCYNFFLFLQSVIFLSSLCREEDFSFLILFRPFKSPSLVCLKTSLFKVPPMPLALLGWQPAEPFGDRANPTLCFLSPARLYQPFAGRWPGLPQLQATGKARTQGNWPTTQTHPGSVYKQIWQRAWPPRSSGRNTTTSKCKTRREEDERNSRAFQMIWSRI